MKNFHMLSVTLVWIGALNWGLVGLFNLNLVTAIFGSMPTLVKLVYILVGAGAVNELVIHKEICMRCREMMKSK